MNDIAEAVTARWADRVTVRKDDARSTTTLECGRADLVELCAWLFSSRGHAFATLIAESTSSGWLLRYVFYGGAGGGLVHVLLGLPSKETSAPSISPLVIAADWHERETEDLFGLSFEGHPRLGDFVLHEDWPENVNPMRPGFDGARPYTERVPDPVWRPLRVVQAAGAFAMPIGPVYSDCAESASFLLETVGEDVIRTIPRFFYKYRGVEKLAEGRSVEDALLLAERFSGTSAFAHGLAFCHAVETIAGLAVPARAQALRLLLAELERLRHHVATISGICQSTALSVATSQASILEEDLLRQSCVLTGHRYLFGMVVPGGLSADVPDDACRELARALPGIMDRLLELQRMLSVTSSFLDRLEEVGIVTTKRAASYSLVGPIARASGISLDLRRVLPYGAYRDGPGFTVPVEEQGDGFARLRVLFAEAEQSAALVRQAATALPGGPVRAAPATSSAGAALGWVEAPSGAAFHWLRLDEHGKVARYRVTSPAFINWHGFHFAAEEFAFQDFPIIMASFGLSNAECDR